MKYTLCTLLTLQFALLQAMDVKWDNDFTRYDLIDNQLGGNGPSGLSQAEGEGTYKITVEDPFEVQGVLLQIAPSKRGKMTITVKNIDELVGTSTIEIDPEFHVQYPNPSGVSVDFGGPRIYWKQIVITVMVESGQINYGYRRVNDGKPLAELQRMKLMPGFAVFRKKSG